MNNKTDTPLILAFIIVVVVFLLSCGGAIAMMMTNNGMSNGTHNSGPLNNISWLWIPTIVSFLVSVLLGWALFGKKNDG